MCFQEQRDDKGKKRPSLEQMRSARMHSRVFKLFTGSFLLLAFVGGFGPLIDPNSYSAKLYQEVIFEVLPWWAWSIVWISLMICIICHLIWSSYLAFFASNILIIFISTSYALMLCYAKYIKDFPLSAVSWSIWVSLTFIAIAGIRADAAISQKKKI